jgi:exodeoxyribonuclease VII small subunit
MKEVPVMEAASRSFEQALERLEQVVGKLERGDCRLEESLALFQEGMELLTYCRKVLADVEGKIAVLTGEAGEKVPFDL